MSDHVSRWCGGSPQPEAYGVIVESTSGILIGTTDRRSDRPGLRARVLDKPGAVISRPTGPATWDSFAGKNGLLVD